MKILLISHFLVMKSGLNLGLININLNEGNFDEDDSETFIHVTLMVWCNRPKQHKVFKKDISKELMPVAWHPTK